MPSSSQAGRARWACECVNRRGLAGARGVPVHAVLGPLGSIDRNSYIRAAAPDIPHPGYWNMSPDEPGTDVAWYLSVALRATMPIHQKS